MHTETTLLDFSRSKTVDAREDDSRQDDAVNAIGAAGQSADPHVGRVVSGQPAGGPHDLGKEASEEERPPRR